MSTVSPVSSASTSFTAPATTSSGTNRALQKQLGQEDFMKLLAVQFQSQDPMKPMEDTAFIAQMAQFSALSQSSAMSTTMDQLRDAQQVATANSYLGHSVMLSDGKGGVISGNVDAVEISNGSPRLVLGQYTYPLSAVLRVEPGVVTAPATPTGGA